MAKARSPDRVKAEKLYRGEGLALNESADKIGVPVSTVRSWKKRDGWDKEPEKPKPESVAKKTKNATRKVQRADKKSATQKASSSGHKRGVGAPPHNHNADGGPPGNKKAEKHGAYSRVYWDTLDEDELDILDQTPDDEAELLEDQIKLFEVREHRIMKAIKHYREMEAPIVVDQMQRTEDKRVFDGTPEEQAEQQARYNEMVQDEIDSGKRKPGRTIHTMTITEDKNNKIIRLEQELSTVQSKKTAAIQALANIRASRNEETSGSDIVHAWADAVMRARQERGDQDG